MNSGFLRRNDSGSALRVEAEPLLHSDKLSSTSSVRPFGPSPIKGKKLKVEDDEGFRLQPKLQEPSIETELIPGDTLASVSLKYNVPAAELKRLNNILTDGEFFALKRIKIPVKPHSLLAEQYQEQKKAEYEALMATHEDVGATDKWLVEHFATPPKLPGSSEISSPAVLSDGSEDHPSLDHAINNLQNSKQVKKTKKFLKNVDKDLAAIKQRNDNLVSTVIPNIGQTVDNDWEDGEEDIFLGDEAQHESEVLLLPSEHSVKVSKVSNKSKMAFVACVALIVISVALILWFADFEYGKISHENLEEARKHEAHAQTHNEHQE